MNFTLIRSSKGVFGIFGQMKGEGTPLVFSTLEHAFKQSDGSYSPVVPEGTYACVRRSSPKFGFDVFMLKEVPGHNFVEIHVGNFNKDSDGCILLGLKSTNISISDSRDAFSKFMALQSGVNEFTLTVVG